MALPLIQSRKYHPAIALTPAAARRLLAPRCQIGRVPMDLIPRPEGV